MPLSPGRLRLVLTAALGPEAGAYVDALEAEVLADVVTAYELVIAILALLSGEPPGAEAVSRAHQMAAFRLNGLTRRFERPGAAALGWERIGAADETLAEALGQLMTPADEPAYRLYQIRAVRGAGIDVVIIEGLKRAADGSTLLHGISFVPALPVIRPALSLLTRQVETTLAWLPIEHLGRELLAAETVPSRIVERAVLTLH